MDPLDLNLLRVFCCVVEQGSLSAAGRALKISKASVSRKLSELEQHVGQCLLFRSTTDVSLTSYGERLYKEVGPVVTQLGHSVQQAMKFDHTLEATVRVTSPEDFGVAVVAPLLAEFSKNWPKVRIECLFTDRSLDLVKESLDLAVRMGPLKESDLVGRKIGDMHFDFVATPQYILENPKITKENLRDHVLVAFGLAGSHLPFTFKNLPPDIKFAARLWSKSFSSIYKLILAGHGAMFLPRFLVSEDCATGRLVKVIPDCTPAPVATHLVTVQRDRVSPGAKEVIKFLSQHLPARLN